MSKPKTIRISEITYARLSRIGVFGESANDLIMRLLTFYEDNNKEVKL